MEASNRCPKCGTVVRATDRFCTECGADVIRESYRKAKPKRRYGLLGWGTLAILLACVFCTVIAKLGSSVTGSTTRGPLATATAKTVSDVDFYGIREQFEDMTDAQKRTLSRSINGKRVEWQGWIDDVQESGRIFVDMDPPETFLSVFDVTFAIPRSDVLEYSLGQQIVFQGDIESITELLGFTVRLDDAEIISVRK
jgi:predicted nucleic acid-binding Zn ribbon protein